MLASRIAARALGAVQGTAAGGARRVAVAPAGGAGGQLASYLAEAREAYESVDETVQQTAPVSGYGSSEAAVEARRTHLGMACDLLVVAISSANMFQARGKLTSDAKAELALARAALDSAEADLEALRGRG